MSERIKNPDSLLDLVATADQAVMQFYSTDIEVEVKSDASPITQADRVSHDILTRGLAELYPDIPVISEEGDEVANAKNVTGDAFWLVDPIDGTKEFIAHNGQFTVCVALIEDGRPTFGIISAPALGVTYYGGPEFGSFKKLADGTIEQLAEIAVANHVLLASRSHNSPQTTAYIEQHYPDYTVDQIGSQLKFTYVAEGNAEVYPRLGHTMKIWDVAAGHAILRGMGGDVTRPDGSPIDYRQPDLLVGDFIAKS